MLTQRILIIEDDQMFSKILEKQLSKLDVNIATCYSVDDGIHLIEQLKPDLIISDFYFNDASEKNGDSVLQSLVEKKINTPILYLSSEANSTIMNKMKNNGAIEFLRKSREDIKQLIALCENILSNINTKEMYKHVEKQLSLAFVLFSLPMLLLLLAGKENWLPMYLVLLFTSLGISSLLLNKNLYS